MPQKKPSFAAGAARFLRRFLPPSMKGRILPMLGMDYAWTLDSGLLVRVGNLNQWAAYNEIFVRGEYDEAIAKMLERANAGAPLHIVDIGAHVGYFTMHVVDRIREHDDALSFTITAIEGNPQRAALFRAFVEENDLSENVRLIEGLAGERSGNATLYDDSIYRPHERPRLSVPWIDLSRALESLHHIDLLKCDIEGAELLLLQNYPDVLAKVHVGIFELHREWCDVEQCEELLRQAGFTGSAAFRESCSAYIRMVWR